MAGRRRPREGGLRKRLELGEEREVRSRVVTGADMKPRGRWAEEERRLARARPQSRGDGFIPSSERPCRAGGYASQSFLLGDRFRAGSPGPERGL